MNTRKFKVGDHALIKADRQYHVLNAGSVVEIVRYNRHFAGHHCWYVRHADGSVGSYSERYLEFHSDMPVTFKQVKEAKEAVDEAQRKFVELLSQYQKQESIKDELAKLCS